MVHSLLHYYLCFPAHIGTGFQIQAQVNATGQTAGAAARPAGKLNGTMTMNGKLLALFFYSFFNFFIVILISPSNEPTIL